MERINRLKSSLSQAGIDAAIISKKESIYYLCELAPTHPLEREAYLFITPQKQVLYHSPFVAPPSNPHLTSITMSAANPLASIIPQTFSSSLSHIGIEKTNLTVAELDRLHDLLPNHYFVAVDDILNLMRQIKDDKEKRLLKKAGKIAKKTYNWIYQFLAQPAAIGISERTCAQLIEHQMRLFGADEPAFPTIVAFDHNSAYPHHVPNNTRLKPNSIILIDMGCRIKQYNSDMTRTWTRQAQSSPQFNRIKRIVDQAYRQAVSLTRSTSPLLANMLDQTARNYIHQHGFASNFIHSTGHGIGLEAHEAPHINPTDTTPLSSGITFTIEPGIYLPHRFGYRHENTFLMTNAGAINLTS